MATRGDTGFDGGRPFRRLCLEAWNAAEEMSKPVIAQIHGACLGGAMELALACDLRVLAEDAVMGVPEVRMGLVPDLGGSSRLPQVVGLAKRVMDASARPALGATLELEVAMQELCARSEDFAEGAKAFQEKRQPEFSGR